MIPIIHHPRRILVTGGAGFIGSHFVHYALKTNEEIQIINLDQLTYSGSLDHLRAIKNDPRHHFVQGNILDRTLLHQLFHDFLIDTVVHFAAETHVDRSIREPMEFVRTNVEGTAVLLDSAKQHWTNTDHHMRQNVRFHHVSTDEIYGSLLLDEPAFTEKSPYQPHSPYAASKAASDHLVMSYHHTYNLPVTLSHSSNNYGAHQHREKFIPTIIRACLEKTPIPIYGNGNNIRDWMTVEDHCRAIWLILNSAKTGSRYNIGSGTELNNLDLVQRICACFDELHPDDAPHAKLIQHVPDRLGHDFRYAINFSKIKSELGWTPEALFSDALKKTILHYTALYREDVYSS